MKKLRLYHRHVPPRKTKGLCKTATQLQRPSPTARCSSFIITSRMEMSSCKGISPNTLAVIYSPCVRRTVPWFPDDDDDDDADDGSGAGAAGAAGAAGGAGGGAGGAGGGAGGGGGGAGGGGCWWCWWCWWWWWWCWCWWCWCWCWVLVLAVVVVAAAVVVVMVMVRVRVGVGHFIFASQCMRVWLKKQGLVRPIAFEIGSHHRVQIAATLNMLTTWLWLEPIVN